MKTNPQPHKTDIIVTRMLWFAIGFIFAILLIYSAVSDIKIEKPLYFI